MINKTMKNKQTIFKTNEHCLKAYGALKCNNAGDYHTTYLYCDVLLLADVFGNFRKTCAEYYDLDPSNY